jgi:hypothetical protein
LLLKDPVLTVKVADVDPAATVTEPGRLRAGLELERLTYEPPPGAA